MQIAEYQRMYRNILAPELVYAGEFLEARGLRFGVEFGTTNAINKAAYAFLLELETQGRLFD